MTARDVSVGVGSDVPEIRNIDLGKSLSFSFNHSAPFCHSWDLTIALGMIPRDTRFVGLSFERICLHSWFSMKLVMLIMSETRFFTKVSKVLGELLIQCKVIVESDRKVTLLTFKCCRAWAVCLYSLTKRWAVDNSSLESDNGLIAATLDFENTRWNSAIAGPKPGWERRRGHTDSNMTQHIYSDTEHNIPNIRESVLGEGGGVSPRWMNEAMHGADPSCSLTTVFTERSLPAAGLSPSGWPSRGPYRQAFP